MSITTEQTTRPNRVTSKKDEKYHLDMGKYTVFSSFDNLHHKWLKTIEINKKFYKGDQWSLKEDKDTFLNDETGNALNRIAFKYNLIRPMVEQYRGNAVILDINATAKSLSKNSLTRREKRLDEQIMKTRTSNEFPNLGKVMKEQDITIGNDEVQTEMIFDSVYVDQMVNEINELLMYSKKLNKFKKRQVKVAMDMALTGLAVQMRVLHGGHLRFKQVEPEDFFWDRDARDYDLSDAEFMGTIVPTEIPYILETGQLKPEDAAALEEYSSIGGNSKVALGISPYRTYTANRVPLVTSYWKDTERYKYGWVKDKDGYPIMARIGESSEKNLEEEEVYTEKDLITPPDSPKNRMLFPNGKKTAMLYVDVLRYVKYIPSEVFGTNNKGKKKHGDIVLEYGIDPYQDTNLYDLSNVKFPFAVATWGYVDGEVFSPIDDVIDPQRFINRILSLTEARFNSSGGTNVIIDEDAVDDVAELYSDIKEGKPITVRSKGKGIPNTVGVYDAMPKQSTYGLLNILPQMKQLMQDVTGVNESLKGESTGSDQLVGVTQLMIQRGSLLQEPFYNAITDVFKQMFEQVASVGKKYYIDNEKELAIISGDEALKIFTLSKDIRNEDFSIYIERENSDDVMKNQANQMLQVFLEMGLIDDSVFTNLYNRSTPSKVMTNVRSYTKMRKEAERREAEAQAQAQQQAMQQEQIMQEQAMAMDQQNQDRAMMEQQRMRQEDIALDREKRLMDHDSKMEQIMAQGAMSARNRGGQ